MYPIELGVVVPNTFREDIDFLSCMLKLCPEDRLTCEEVRVFQYKFGFNN